MVNKFFMMDWTTKRIIGPLTETEVCVTARILMQLSSTPSFDIMEEASSKVIVTHQFSQADSGVWRRDECREEAHMDMVGLRNL